jgi:hypothetical protein
MGIREGGQSILPEWKRGHFSLIYDGSGGGENGRPLAVFVNRTKEKWVDLLGNDSIFVYGFSSEGRPKT